MSSNDKLNKFINMIKGYNRLFRAVVYLDGKCVKVDDETFDVNGLIFKYPKEWQESMVGYIDFALSELAEIAQRVGMTMIPISLVVMRVWVCLGHGCSPCVIYHVVKDYLSRMGIEVKEMKALGEEYVSIDKILKAIQPKKS